MSKVLAFIEQRGGVLKRTAGEVLGASRRLADKNQILMLHCLSGGRSEIAKRILKGSGYTQVFNLGPYGRAGRIVSRVAK